MTRPSGMIDVPRNARRKAMVSGMTIGTVVVALVALVFTLARMGAGEFGQWREERAAERRMEAACAVVGQVVESFHGLRAAGVVSRPLDMQTLVNSIARRPVIGGERNILLGARPQAVGRRDEGVKVCAFGDGKGVRFTLVGGVSASEAQALQERLGKAVTAAAGGDGDGYRNLFGLDADREAGEGAPASTRHVHLCIGS